MSEERARVLTPVRRVGSFKEVVLGLNAAGAVENARIYLERERALKGQPCPLGTDHVALVRCVARGGHADMSAALDLLLATNALPEVTGRLCGEVFEETMCQNRHGDRVSLRAIERFLAEHAHPRQLPTPSDKQPKIAIAGSGPSGLCAAWALARRNYRVTVFDSAPFLGGTLAYSHGQFELPSQVLRSIIRRLEAAGIVFVKNFLFGRTALPADLLEEGFGAVLIATGVAPVTPMGIPGESAGGVFSADDFLKAVNCRGEDPGLWLGRKVLVVGESDPAFACARIAIRLKRVATVVIRGPETQIKALPMFARHAAEEGVKFKSFTKPVSVLTGANGCVSGLACRYLDYRMDAQGRMVLVEDGSSDVLLEADTIITARGWGANTLFLRDIPGLEYNTDGSLRTRPEFAETSLRGVFAAGGVVEPEMSLTDAMLSGVRAAGEIDKYLNG